MAISRLYADGVTDIALKFSRHVPLDGCFNFRDLGGYRTSDGRWTRPERLYRADGPHALTENDAVILRRLGLATVIDLRTAEEVDQRGCYASVVSDVVEYHLPMLDVVPDVAELPSWIDPSFTARRYREMLEKGRNAIAEVLAILTDPSAYPAMFHCSAGKDRTGLIAAVVLGIAGVPDDAIVSDYALSAAPMRRLMDHYVATYPDAVDQLERVAAAMLAADPFAMSLLIQELRSEYGSFTGYAHAIGVGSAPEYIRDHILV